MKYKLLILALLIAIAGCTTGQATAENTIKIGIITPTTGDYAFLGENLIRSAEASAEQLGIANRVEFIAVDGGDVGGGASAINAYKKLVEIHGIELLIAGTSSDGTLAYAAMLDADEVVAITPLTGGENIDNAAEYLFRNGPSDIKAGTLPAQLLNEQGIQTVALFTDNAAYTHDISKHFRNMFEGEIVVDEVVAHTQKDFRTSVAKIPKDTDAIVIHTSAGRSANYLFKQLREAGYEQPIHANFLAYSPAFFEIAGQAIEGVYIWDPEYDTQDTRTTALFQAMEEQYGKGPSIPFHTTGTYDAIEMFVTAVNEVGYDGPAVREWLLNLESWNELNGNVTFDEKGNTDTGFVLKVVENGELVIV